MPFAVTRRTRPAYPGATRVLDPVLLVTAWAETVTLVVLLVNLATVHAEWVTSSVGPLHGGLYVVCSAAVLAMRWVRGWSWLVIVLGILPAVGALVALEVLRRDRRSSVAVA